MEIKKDRCLDGPIVRKWNGRVKVVTGISCSGKSYFLFRLSWDHLVAEWVPEDHIITVALDDFYSRFLRDALKLTEHVTERVLFPDGMVPCPDRRDPSCLRLGH